MDWRSDSDSWSSTDTTEVEIDEFGVFSPAEEVTVQEEEGLWVQTPPHEPSWGNPIAWGAPMSNLDPTWLSETDRSMIEALIAIRESWESR